MLEIAGGLIVSFFGVVFVWRFFEQVIVLVLGILALGLLWGAVVLLFVAVETWLSWDGNATLFEGGKLVFDILAYIVSGLALLAMTALSFVMLIVSLEEWRGFRNDEDVIGASAITLLALMQSSATIIVWYSLIVSI